MINSRGGPIGPGTLLDVKLLRRRGAESAPAATEPDQSGGASAAPTGRKGRPTPKRREVAPKRGPVSAPRTRKEAAQRQRQQAKAARSSGKSVSNAEYRQALRRGDPSALPARDRGPTRKLARDYVDSRRMLSNFLLLVFPVMFASVIIPALNLAAIILLILFAGEWYLTGRKIKAMAVQRGYKEKVGPWSLGFYAGSRAYLPRRFRLPAPQVQLGESI